MRKLIVNENISLDGVMESPERWAFAYQGADMAALNREGMGTSSAVVLGRRTYEEFAAYWQFQADDGSGIADHLNNTTKLVVSSTLREASWANSTIIGGDLATAFGDLKRQPGGDMVVIGSATLVQSLLREDLVDELVLFVYPVVLGRGKRLFGSGEGQITLRLVESRAIDGRIVLLRYGR